MPQLGGLYQPDPRNAYHQRYCSEPACRHASKTASQQRWRASPKGRAYFRGTANVTPVRAWRQAHPGYWRARQKLIAAQLIAYQRPLYQVLALGPARKALSLPTTLA